MSERNRRPRIVAIQPGYSAVLEPTKVPIKGRTMQVLDRIGAPTVITSHPKLTIILEPITFVPYGSKETKVQPQVPLIEMQRISLSDQIALNQISHNRDFSDYKSEGIFSPANVNRKLFSSACIERLKATAQEVENQGVSDLGLIIVNHKFPHPTFANIYQGINESIPLETGVSYTYSDPEGEQTRIAGSPIISALHSLSRSKISLSKEQQQYVIQEHFGHYLQFLPNHDVTVLAIPPRQEGSPTHKAFAEYAVVHPVTGNVVEHTTFGGRQVDLYFFAHGEGEVLERNTKKAQKLMTDLRYRGVLETIDEAWNTNFRSIQNLSAGDEQAVTDRVIAAFQTQTIGEVLIDQSSLC